MALDSNVMKDAQGESLPHFTPWPLPESAGVNLFEQRLVAHHNYYCFPPFGMVSAVLAFLVRDNPRPLQVSLVVPRLSPLSAWWPNLVQMAKMVCLGTQGDKGVIERPTKHGYSGSTLSCPLFLARIVLV
jgi:hypothetical protein